MTDVLFINATNHMSLKHEANGTLLLATKLLQDGFDARILRFAEIEASPKNYWPFIEEITRRILDMQPKCVSFYTLWPYYHIMLRIAARLREEAPHILLILGGPQSSATAEATMKAMPYIDYICTGEGENTVVPFFRALLRPDGPALEEIPGLFYRAEGKILSNSQPIPLCDLDTLPYWDDRLIENVVEESRPYLGTKHYFLPIDAGRGCPYSCTFCCSSYFWKRMYRLKSPQRIVEDIRYYHQRYGVNSFWFSHDAFTSRRKLVEQVCDHIIEQGLNIYWGCSTRVDCITEELILKMKESGLIGIELGIETGSRRMQKLINKNLDLDKARSMIRFMLKQKLRIELFFMYGFPEETEEDLNQTLELIFDLVDDGVREVAMAFCRFNPTTAITEQYQDQLVLDTEVTALHRGVNGYWEELDMIRENPEIFPFLYHLHTPVRDQYHFLFLLVYLYQKYPKSIRYLRRLYKGDNLRFYRDFCEKNPFIFGQGFEYAVYTARERSAEVFCNVLGGFDEPYIPQLKGLMQFEFDSNRVFKSPEDCTVRKTYDFSYIDYKLGLPIESYSQGRTEIELSKVGGVKNMQVLHIG